jgi:hypothetical protein
MQMDRPVLLGALGLGVGILGVTLIKKTLQTKWKVVGKVDDLRIFPLKRGKGIQVTSAEFEQLGMRGAVYRDRSFCIVDDR